MKKEEVIRTLPDDLIERIMARIPFPAIFKARCLSKSWLGRFSPVGAQGNEAEKRLAVSFQNQVRERSKAWKTLSPVLFGKEGDLLAFDRESFQWRQLPSLPFLRGIIRSKKYAYLGFQIAGALLYVRTSRSREMYVANILTSTWKKLPLLPTIDPGQFHNKQSLLVLTDECLETYKVIVFCDLVPGSGSCLCHIYESTSHSWSSKKIDDKHSFVRPQYFTCSVYLEGVMYLLGDNNPLNLWTFNVEESTLEKLSFNGDPTSYWYPNLLVVKGDLLMIATILGRDLQNFPAVLKIELGSSRMVRLAQGPTASIAGSICVTPGMGSQPHIYIRERVDDRRLLYYNRVGNFWGYLLIPPSSGTQEVRWIPGSFEPGLNPFAAV